MKLLPGVTFYLVGPLAYCLSASLLAAPVTAKKDGVQILAEAQKEAKVVVVINKGESVEAGDRQGMFWQVQTKDGKKGFVSVLNVQRQSSEDAGLANALREEALKTRKESENGNVARARSTVMGVRGLDESKDTASAGNILPDLKAVYRMEDRVVEAARVGRLEGLISKEIESTTSKSKVEVVAPDA